MNEKFQIRLATQICSFLNHLFISFLYFTAEMLCLLSVSQRALYSLTCTWGGLKSRLYTLPLGGWIQRRLRRSLSVSNGMFRVITRSSSQILSRASAWTNVLGKPKCQKQNISNARHFPIPVSQWNIFSDRIIKSIHMPPRMKLSSGIYVYLLKFNTRRKETTLKPSFGIWDTERLRSHMIQVESTLN